ncbi:conserved hypothetical protein [Talaromyces stipitatus ATCC 10500]|uniref:Uncharacterized protein n=1 Tax=Talaromyces stipitatus (strain ATCC 10500 / CBS 375.48 / QM 6759 / NRRL 1006) TaxID=441959 RepID=B8ML50_TALSN|nr:uncharacterized protein TSTA_049060 [Talaromyces stipitatus ATCC 10500]EED15466.1 conserved hypothetical protein [Talaromyces stipitatus ATCC 10500]
MRRAVTATQLMGLHERRHYRFKVLNDDNGLDPVNIWNCIVSMENIMFLVLGPPSSTGGTTSNPAMEKVAATSSTTAPSLRNQSSNILPTLIIHATSKILKRNQLYIPQQTFDMTREIDQELIKMTEQLPSSSWRPPSLAGLELDSVQAFWEARRAWDHMYYYTIVNQLHLPYTLCMRHTPRVIYSSMACVNASRKILIRQIAIHFVALIAGMTLILAHLVSHSHDENDKFNSDNVLVHQRSSDRVTLEQALECMK